MSISLVIISLLAALAIGLITLIWQDSVWNLLVRYYHREEETCADLLKKTHIEIPRHIAPLFYLCGPLVTTLICLTLVPTLFYKVLAALILSYFLRKTGRRVATYLYNRRIRKIKEQLIDSMGLVANALRSGLSLLQGLEMAANDMPGAIAQEFKTIVSETQLGETLENTLINFKKRIPLKEVATMVDSIRILRETGGNLVETFEILTHTLREEQRVQQKIKTMTTQGIAQAVVIILLPFGLGAALYLMAPDYILPLFQHWLGWIFIAFMLILQFTGGFIMKKIVTIEI